MPSILASGATLALGMLILAVSTVAAATGNADSGKDSVGSFVAILGADGSTVTPSDVWLYPFKDLANCSRTPMAAKGGDFRLRRGERYVVNVRVTTPVYKDEYAATESPDWRHFDLYFVESTGAMFNLQKLGTYVKDGIAQNSNGRFILFSIP